MNAPLRLLFTAAALATSGILLAWWASPRAEREVYAGERDVEPPVEELTQLGAGNGSLEIKVHGLRIPMGEPTHPLVTATLQALASTGEFPLRPWAATVPVMDSIASFGAVPTDATFRLVLRSENGEELLRANILGPQTEGEGGLDPEQARAEVSLGRIPR